MLGPRLLVVGRLNDWILGSLAQTISSTIGAMLGGGIVRV